MWNKQHNSSWNRSHFIFSNKTTKGRSDTGNIKYLHNTTSIVLSRNTGSLYVADKHTVTRWGSAWEISVTLTLECRPGGEQRASIWMSGLREVPGKSGVLTHTTERHSPVLIGSHCSQILSWLLPGKKEYKNSEQNNERGWVRRGGGGLWTCGGVGWLKKKGRMLITVAKEVRGISSLFPIVSLEQSWAQFFRYSSGALEWLSFSHFNA